MLFVLPIVHLDAFIEAGCVACRFCVKDTPKRTACSFWIHHSK